MGCAGRPAGPHRRAPGLVQEDRWAAQEGRRGCVGGPAGLRRGAAIYVFSLPAGDLERYGAPALLPG
ncbi:hypothetical protein [Sorangium sp. So ce341]|uniref:hypothetical protein n=1 Tax=Sorangium sp. So ce341 TaxID=3133302 RepID=UPI003F6113D7